MRQEARLRILLIEDDRNDAELLHACLAEAVRGGAEIVQAGSLAMGLRVLESQPIHLTVLDLDLPSPVVLLGLHQGFVQRLELFYVRPRIGRIATASCPQGTGEIGDGFGIFDTAWAWFEPCGLRPLSPL